MASKALTVFTSGRGSYFGQRTATGFLIVLPLPPKELSPNARVHWARKCKATRRYRRDAGCVALTALEGSESPQWVQATATLRFYFPKGRVMDHDNAIASMKAGFDGIADAGLVANDSGLRPVVEFLGVDAERPRVEIRIETK